MVIISERVLWFRQVSTEKKAREEPPCFLSIGLRAGGMMQGMESHGMKKMLYLLGLLALLGVLLLRN